MELSYHFLSLTHAPRRILISGMLPEIETALAKVKEHEADPSKYYNGHGYWDDFALGHFLQGVCLRYIAHAVSIGSFAHIVDTYIYHVTGW